MTTVLWIGAALIGLFLARTVLWLIDDFKK